MRSIVLGLTLLLMSSVVSAIEIDACPKEGNLFLKVTLRQMYTQIYNQLISDSEGTVPTDLTQYQVRLLNDIVDGAKDCESAEMGMADFEQVRMRTIKFIDKLNSQIE